MESSTPPRDTGWAMSEESVDLVRRLLEMFAKREHEAVFACRSPDIEWDATAWESDCGGERHRRMMRCLSRSPSTPRPASSPTAA